ncbi:MAG: hypothetical protein ACR2RD_04395, partial [Woeseiaceae bacterium]
LNGKPALLQYIPGKHALRPDLSLHVRGDYPESGDIEIEIEAEKAQTFPLMVRVPEWADGFEATVEGETYTAKENRLLEIERSWSPGDILRVKIPMKIRVVADGDETTESVAFVRGPQVLATDVSSDAIDGINWHNYTCTQDSEEKTFHLVNFADAGQEREEYCVLQDGIDDD